MFLFLFFLRKACTTMNFPLGIAFAASHRLMWLCFHCHLSWGIFWFPFWFHCWPTGVISNMLYSLHVIIFHLTYTPGCFPGAASGKEPTCQYRRHKRWGFNLWEEMVTHSSILAWRIPRTEEPGGLRPMGPHRVGHDWRDLAHVSQYT